MRDKLDLVQVIMRVPPEVRAKLKALASAQGKSMEGLMVELIEREWIASGWGEKDGCGEEGPAQESHQEA